MSTLSTFSSSYVLSSLSSPLLIFPELYWCILSLTIRSFALKPEGRPAYYTRKVSTAHQKVIRGLRKSRDYPEIISFGKRKFLHSILRPHRRQSAWIRKHSYISHSQLWSVTLGHVLRIRIIPSILKRGLRRIHSYSSGLIITLGNIGPLLSRQYYTGLISHVTP